MHTYILKKNLSIFCSHPDTLQETEFKDDGLVHLAEEISRQPNFKAVAWLFWLLWTTFTVRIRSKQQSRKTWKTWSLVRKAAYVNLEPKEVWLKRLVPLEKALYFVLEDVLMASEESAIPYPSQIKTCKSTVFLWEDSPWVHSSDVGA